MTKRPLVYSFFPFTMQGGTVDILEGTAQRRPFQFVVIWIGDAQSTYLHVQHCSGNYCKSAWASDLRES